MPTRPVIIIMTTIRPMIIIGPAVVAGAVAAARTPVQELACISIEAIEASFFYWRRNGNLRREAGGGDWRGLGRACGRCGECGEAQYDGEGQ
jgi:hypothetical protein